MADTTQNTQITITTQPKGESDRKFLDPLVECFFDLEISYKDSQIAQAYFHSLSGGEMSIALIEHNLVFQNGGSTTRFIPGPTSFEPITLSQGVTSDLTFWTWWADVTKGKKSRRDGTIRAYGTVTKDGGDPALAEWSLGNVWPLSISGFSFDLDSSNAFIAQITLVAESIERIS